MSSCAGHVTTETVFGQTLPLWLGNGDEHRTLESDTTGLNVKGNLYLTPLLQVPWLPVCFPFKVLIIAYKALYSLCPGSHISP